MQSAASDGAGSTGLGHRAGRRHSSGDMDRRQHGTGFVSQLSGHERSAVNGCGAPRVDRCDHRGHRCVHADRPTCSRRSPAAARSSGPCAARGSLGEGSSGAPRSLAELCSYVRQAVVREARRSQSNRARTVAAAVLAAVNVCQCGAPPAVPLRELILDQQEFSTSTTLDVDRVIVRNAANVRVRSGASFFLRTKQLVIEGPSSINGDGEDNATAPRIWDSRDSTSSFDCELMHNNWAAATTSGVPVGGPGGDGANIEIRYQTLAPESRPLSELTVTANGGRGAITEVQLCGCWTRNRDSMHLRHRRESDRGPSGSPGVIRVLAE
jgi:hypothetical protein